MSKPDQQLNEFEKLQKAIQQSNPNYIRHDFFGKSFDELHKEVSPYKGTQREFQGDGKQIYTQQN